MAAPAGSREPNTHPVVDDRANIASIKIEDRSGAGPPRGTTQEADGADAGRARASNRGDAREGRAGGHARVGAARGRPEGGSVDRRASGAATDGGTINNNGGHVAAAADAGYTTPSRKGPLAWSSQDKLNLDMVWVVQQSVRVCI